MRELKGFEKVELEPGEEKTVFFTLDKSSFAYYENKIHDWYVENGEFAIEIASSSRDIRLESSVLVSGSPELPIVYTRNSTIKDLVKTRRGREMAALLLGNNPMHSTQNEDTKNPGDQNDTFKRETAH